MLILVRHNRQLPKPIFSSSFFLESSIAFCDLCFAMIDAENELSYECKICNNFVACLGCIKRTGTRILSHPADHLFFPSKPASNTRWNKRNLHIKCVLCGQENFLGKHYRCRQCSRFDVCSNCLTEAKCTHPFDEHLFDFVPNSTTIHSNRHLLAERAIQILIRRDVGPFDRDEVTGWTLDEAATISSDECKNYWTAWKEACELLHDDDLDSQLDIIEHDKDSMPLVSIADN